MRRLAWLLAVVAVAGSLACDDAAEPPIAPANPLADSADQVMWNLRVMLTDHGVNRARLEADTGFFFEQNSRIEMRNVRTVFFDEMGRQSAVLTAKEGTYTTRTSTAEARRDVVVVSEDGRRLTTEQLRYSPQNDRISSDSAFVLTEPTRRLEGIGFTSDPNMDNVTVLRLRGGEGGRINLPGERTP